MESSTMNKQNNDNKNPAITPTIDIPAIDTTPRTAHVETIMR